MSNDLQSFMMNPTSGRSGFTSSSNQWCQPPRTHPDITCDHCRKMDFSGLRYKCLCCPNYDLCEQCMTLNEKDGEEFHVSSHLFVRVNKTRDTRGGFNSKPQPHVLVNRSGMVHDVNCSHCRGAVVGFRYFCATCGINLCEACEMVSSEFHQLEHSLLKMAKVAYQPIPVRQEYGFAMANFTSGRSGLSPSSASGNGYF